MDSISRGLYEEVIQRLNQLSVRSNRHKVALFTPRNTDPSVPLNQQLTEMERE